MPTFREFLATGELGPLRLGMTAEEVVAALGTPDGEAVQRTQRGLKYGALQLWLQRCGDRTERLAALFLYFDARGELPPAVRFADAVPVTCAAVSDGLTAAGIVPIWDATEPADEIRLPSGVTFGFDEGMLYTISCVARESAGTPRKQLTLSLPVEVFAELQARAQRDRRSVTELAAALLEAGARQAG